MHGIDRFTPTLERTRALRITSFLAASAIFLAGCGDATPYHEVTVKPHQTLDTIGDAECGPSFLGLSILARRNRLREFNGLDGDDVTLGQTIKVPNSLCSDTGDKASKS